MGRPNSRAKRGGVGKMSESYWWCPNCKRECDPKEVTFHENHETCGARITLCNADYEMPLKKMHELESLLSAKEKELAEAEKVLESCKYIIGVHRTPGRQVLDEIDAYFLAKSKKEKV